MAKEKEATLVIELDETTRIRKDDHQMIVERRRKNGKTGEFYWTPRAYFGSLDQLFNWILEQRILSKHHKNIKTLAKFMIDTKKEIFNYFEKHSLKLA
tara:strand:- start:9481 stop:9774 length:294 start_codon:yes stop_codon:yes gene_type:complete